MHELHNMQEREHLLVCVCVWGTTCSTMNAMANMAFFVISNMRTNYRSRAPGKWYRWTIFLQAEIAAAVVMASSSSLYIYAYIYLQVTKKHTYMYTYIYIYMCRVAPDI